MSVSNETLTQIILTPPNTIKGSKKNEKIVYSEIITNGKKGIFVNVNSKTPDNKLKRSLMKFWHLIHFRDTGRVWETL